MLKTKDKLFTTDFSNALEYLEKSLGFIDTKLKPYGIDIYKTEVQRDLLEYLIINSIYSINIYRFKYNNILSRAVDIYDILSNSNITINLMNSIDKIISDLFPGGANFIQPTFTVGFLNSNLVLIVNDIKD